MSVEGAQTQLTEADFSGLEKLVGTPLPKYFKEHYLKCNGGFPTEEFAEANPSPLHGFFSIKYGTLSIETLLKEFAEQNILFGKKIPFAYDAGDNLFVLSLEEDQTYGQILFIGHEFLKEKDYQLVSNKFSEFLQKYATWF